MADELSLVDVSGGPDVVVLCPTAGLAQALREAHGAMRRTMGEVRWQPLDGATPAQWLDRFCAGALLRGELPPGHLPGGFLDRRQEVCLWVRAIEADLAEAGGEAVFDIEALAAAAQGADGLARTWQMRLAAGEGDAELAAFLRWRKRVEGWAATERWLTPAEALAWRIGCVERGLGVLPGKVLVAGFDFPDPLLQRLLDAFAQRGAEVARLALPRRGDAVAWTHRALDRAAECADAAGWAAGWLAREPQARLRIAVADFEARRVALVAAMQAALPSVPDCAPCWRIEPQPLARQPLIDTAMRLLRVVAMPQRLEFATLSILLRGPGWAADVSEAAARACFERGLRDLLGPETTLSAWSRLASAEFLRLALPKTRAAINRLHELSRSPRRRLLPGAWGERFTQGLAEAGWPGERAPTPVEHAAREALLETLRGLARLDAVAGRIDVAAALRLLQRELDNQALRLPHVVVPSIEIVPLTEAAGAPVDGLWVIGLEATQWPPPAQTNPLLPALAQRRAGVPQACQDRLVHAARRLQADWCGMAREVVLSSPLGDDGHPLRPSPMLDGMAPWAGSSAAPTEFAQIIQLEYLEDAVAPGPDGDELARLRGGTALLAAQAACPAWAFFRYRLGAAALPSPVVGLDAACRGELLHGALEAFWRGRDQAWLLGLEAAERNAKLCGSAAAAVARFTAQRPGRIGPRSAELEQQRLVRLLAHWLSVEAERAPFAVVECEAPHRVSLGALSLRVVVDRMDRLADGRLVLIDYKGGRGANSASWAQPRILEPQLPLYASFVAVDETSPLAAVALARVHRERCDFDGVATEPGLLPGVDALEQSRGRFPAEEFADWSALLARWRKHLQHLADEFLAGDAAVRGDEADLTYCDVNVLLRLADRRSQYASVSGETA